MGVLDKEATTTQPVSTQLRGETMAYALQHIFYNLGANIYEPYIGYRVQKRYSGPDAGYGNYKQNLTGELAGDVVGAGSLILAEALFPGQLHACTRTMRGWIDPLYTTVAHRIFAREKNQPGYERKVEEWKTFQERNLVRSALMVTTGMAGNIATQKWLAGNPAPTRVIFTGKLASMAVTTALSLGVRFAFPDRLKRVDCWLSRNIFEPMMKDGQAGNEPLSHADRVLKQSHTESLAPAR